jgi:hypothetical protein
VTAATARFPHARLIVGAIAVLACTVLLLGTRTYNFYFDEWDFILAAPTWSFVSFLQPHNEHPAMLTKLVYAALLNTVGLRSYLPYMAVLLAVHAANVLLLFELVRRRAGDVVGLGAAMLLLFIGAGWENLLWAFQVSFDGSVAFGLAAMLLMQRRSTAAVGGTVALVAASIMCSGVGLFFAVTVAVYLLADPARRRDLLWFVPLGLLVVAWYVAFGRQGVATNPPPSAGNVLRAPLYAVWGIGEAAAGLIGEGGWWGPPALLVSVAVVAWTWWRRRPDGVALGAAAGLVVFYLVTGLSRAQFGYEQSGAGRYVYEGAVFWLILLGDAARDLPWRDTWRPALAACLFLACFSSSALLFEFAAAKAVQMQREAADLQALDAARSQACAQAKVDDFVMPQVTDPALYYRAVDSYGDPAPALPVADRADYDRAIAHLGPVCAY